MTDHAETSLPCLTFTATIPGDLPALGRLVVDEDQAKDQLSLIWGVRSRRYSAAATAALFWQAEALTAVAAGATAAAGPSGASGSGSNTIYANALTTSWQDILKSTVGSTYWTHVGGYRVMARVQAKSGNTGDVTVRAAWANGDLATYATGSAKATTAGAWVLVDLGVLNVPAVLTGTQRWELRLQAKSTVSLDDVYVDWIMLIPVDEASGTAQVTSAGAPLTQTISDEFDRASGNLDGDTPAPQTDGTGWVESTAGSFTTDATYDYVKRTSVSDAGSFPSGMSANAKFAAVGGAMTGSYVMCDLFCTTSYAIGVQGVMLRYQDASNWLAAIAYNTNLYIVKCDAGTETILAATSCVVPAVSSGGAVVGGQLFLYAPSNGGVYASAFQVTAAGVLGGYVASLSASDSALATGGALASGKAGLIDWQSSATPNTRSYDNLKAGTVTAPAACFASQSAQVRWDGTVREDAAGNVLASPGRVEGDNLLVPCSGQENRPVEVIVKMSRALIGTAGDEGTDDLSARLYVQPRFLQLPA